MRTMLAASLFGSVLSLALACSRDAAPPPAEPAAAAAVAPAPAKAPTRRVATMTSSSPDVPAMYMESERLRYDARIEEADAKLGAVLAADPGFARALVRTAHHMKADERGATLARARTSAATLPPLEQRWVLARIAQAEGDNDEAYQEFLAIAELAPEDWEIQMVTAEQTQFHYSKIPEARVILERAIAAEPTWAAPFNLLAYGYSQEGDLDRAVTAITKYAELAPGQANPLDSKGEILLEAGRLDEAEAAFRAALKVDPRFRAEDGIAAIQLHRGDTAGALAIYERVYAAQKGRPGLRWELGVSLLWAYMIGEQYDRATALAGELEQAAADSGHFRPEAYGHIFRARVASYREQWKDALGHLDRARATMDGHDDAPTAFLRRTIDQQRVRALIGMGKLDQADKLRADLVATVADDDPARLATLLVAHARGDLAAAKAAAVPLFDHRQHGTEAKLLIADLVATAHPEKATKLRQQVSTTYARDPRSYVMRLRAQRALR